MFEAESVRASVRDFVSWIALYVPLNVPKHESAYPEGTDPLENPADGGARLEGSGFDPTEIGVWAQKCANILTDKEKAVFYLRFGTAKTLREIAQATGFQAASSAYYVLESSVEKLKNFLIDLPGLSPDDLNEEAFSCFRDALLEILKKTASGS